MDANKWIKITENLAPPPHIELKLWNINEEEDYGGTLYTYNQGDFFDVYGPVSNWYEYPTHFLIVPQSPEPPKI